MRLFIILFSSFLFSCSHIEHWYIEPEDLEQSKVSCERACDNLRRLKCPEADNLSDGTTCETFCFDTERNGLGLNTKCLSEIQYCSEINTCTSGL